MMKNPLKFYHVEFFDSMIDRHANRRTSNYIPLQILLLPIVENIDNAKHRKTATKTQPW